MTKAIVEDIIKKERGHRIKILRKQTHLSRRAFGSKHGIPSGTLQYWEDGNFGGLSEDGAQKLVNAFAKEGIWVTPAWLLNGTGKEPSSDPYRFSGQASILAEDLLIREAMLSVSSITQELKFFLKLHALAMHEVVTDDLMMPRFIQGEYVAGIQKFEEEIQTIIGKDCIIKLKNNKILVRRLIQSVEPTCFELVSINPDKPQERMLIPKSEILCAANVIWARRDEE